LNGQFLNVHLENLHDGGADLASSGNDTEAQAKFKKLANANT
jgi:hypothetical protein